MTIPSAPDPDPLAAHNATLCTAQPTHTNPVEVTLPPLTIPAEVLSSEHTTDFDDFATELYEWLSLVRLESPRLRASDSIDGYLSRYRVPGNPDSEKQGTAKISKMTWRGFLNPTWAKKLLIDALVAAPSKSWLGFSATTFAQGLTSEAREVAFLRPPETPDEYFVWEVRGHE
jgi:ribonucleases P/MRP protein subunit RPP40